MELDEIRFIGIPVDETPKQKKDHEAEKEVYRGHFARALKPDKEIPERVKKVIYRTDKGKTKYKM